MSPIYRIAILLAAMATAILAAEPVRIMPVGDSITQGGKTYEVYRLPLLEKLKAAGYDVVYVGSRKSESKLGPLAHEGYGGKNAEFLAGNLKQSLRDHPADVVLIHAGHNHFVDEKPVPGIIKATESMIATCREANPRMVVLLAQVIPAGKLPKYAYIPELNGELAKLAERMHKPEQPVILVNQFDGFDVEKDTIADKVHPNERGAEKMAARWFEALAKVLEKPKGK